jgi:methyl-accepting chemotaxis protein
MAWVITGASKMKVKRMTGVPEQWQESFHHDATEVNETDDSSSKFAEIVDLLEGLINDASSNAGRAMDIDKSLNETSDESQKVVMSITQTLGAIEEISQFTKQITSITGSIEQIAFQTNMLALNANIEAAHAGAHGRGFNVVANEVRDLAQRSTQLAQEIKKLTDDSAHVVNEGEEQVEHTAEMLGDLRGQIKQITDVASELSSSSQEQVDKMHQVRKILD